MAGAPFAHTGCRGCGEPAPTCPLDLCPGCVGACVAYFARVPANVEAAQHRRAKRDHAKHMAPKRPAQWRAWAQAGRAE